MKFSNSTKFFKKNNFITDVIFGPIESYSLAQIIRFAGVWETPVISPGGMAEAFTMKESLVNIHIKFSHFHTDFSERISNGVNLIEIQTGIYNVDTFNRQS